MRAHSKRSVPFSFDGGARQSILDERPKSLATVLGNDDRADLALLRAMLTHTQQIWPHVEVLHEYVRKGTSSPEARDDSRARAGA
jgi:hypothetical protein